MNPLAETVSAVNSFLPVLTGIHGSPSTPLCSFASIQVVSLGMAAAMIAPFGDLERSQNASDLDEEGI